MTKIGLVLGGGGTRGYAHIGALKVLSKLGVNVDAIAGCSIGALVGASLSAGKTPEEMETYSKKLGLLDIFDINISLTGIKTTTKIEKIFNDMVGVKNFEDLKIPLFINAVNLTQTKETVFSKGNLFDAIRASVSIPGLVSPYKIGNEYYVDGGVLNVDPVSILPNDIKKFIIIDVSPLRSINMNKANIIDILDTSLRIMQKESKKSITKKIPKNNYVIIKPELSEHNMLEARNKYNDIILKGEKAALEKENEIKALVQRN